MPAQLIQIVVITFEIFCAASSISAQEIFIRVNQLGYKTTYPKLALVFAQGSLPPKFAVIDAATHRSVFQSVIRPIAGHWGEFDYFGELEFSTFHQLGEYRLQIGDAQSLSFQINDSIYRHVPDELLEFMRQQRCGYNPFVDAVCHSFDGRTAFGPLPAGTYIDARGGWHDAGDQLKYLLTASNATAQMLLAYELRPREFQDRFNSFGQPGANGVPDVLDEARWGLDWMLRLHPAPDQLYHQVADARDHKGWRLPQDEIADYGWGKGAGRVVYCTDGQPQGLQQYKSESTGVANLAGRYAAAMALAYQIWRDDPNQRAFAERCLQAGEEVYELGRTKEGVQQGNSYKAPYRYAETTWADDMEWGAAELYRARRERRYLDDAKRYARLADSESWMGKEQTGHYQYYPFMNLGHFRLYDLVDRDFKKLLAGPDILFGK